MQNYFLMRIIVDTSGKETTSISGYATLVEAKKAYHACLEEYIGTTNFVSALVCDKYQNPISREYWEGTTTPNLTE